MESKMLAEINAVIKPEIAQADCDLLDKQLKASEKRLESRTFPSAAKPSMSTEKTIQETDEQSVVNFGWEELNNGTLIPFVKRGLKNYVANHIVGELVYKKIQEDFSNEMLICMALIMERMSQKEADTFNEININHSDRTIVGNYNFKQNEYMIDLEYVQKFVQYYQACRNLILCKIKDNDLFGFLQIAGENQVPFLFNNGQKLVPLFYFEGQSEYLDSRSINLEDPFKIGYIKFCCKVQKINKDFYEQNPLKVVDFEDVKKLFPAGTTFEVTLPEKVNQDLLAPKISMAPLHGLSYNGLSFNQDPSTNSASLNLSISKNPISTDLLLKSSRASKRSSQISENTKAKRVKISNSTIQLSTYREQARTLQPQLSEVQRSNQTQDLSILPQDITVTPVYCQRPFGQQRNPERISELATITPIAAPSPTLTRTSQDIDTSRLPSNYQITNVPYRSPRSASSPGFPFPNQIMSEAAQRVPRYPENTIASVPELNSKPTPQTTIVCTTGNYQPNVQYSTQQYTSGTNLPIPKVNSKPTPQTSTVRATGTYQPNVQYGTQQYTSGTIPHYSHQQQINSTQRHNYSIPISVQSGSNDFTRGVVGTSYYQSAPAQMASSQFQRLPPAPNVTVRQFSNVNEHYVNVNSQIKMKQNECWQMFSRQMTQQQQILQRSYFPHPTPTTMQQTSAQFLSSSPLSGQDNNNNNNTRSFNAELKTVVVEHQQSVDSVPEFYHIKMCVVKHKELLGISKSTTVPSFLVNLSEFVEKVLGRNPFGHHSDVPFRFKSLYRLNSAQKWQWILESRKRQLEFVGPFKDLFVEYSEIVLY